MSKIVFESLEQFEGKEIIKPGDLVYFLYDYTLEKGLAEFIGNKNIKIAKTRWDDSIYYKRVPIEKVVLSDEMICIVWERWKGKNGRGGYRIEKKLYKNRQKLAKEWPYQALVWEDFFGKESNYIDPRLE
jgi:hypothetical protein